MSPEAIAALGGVLVAWLEFKSAHGSRNLHTRVALLEHRLEKVESREVPSCKCGDSSQSSQSSQP